MDLLRLFKPFGDISGISLATSANEQRSAFVQFVDAASAEKAVEKVSGVPLGDGTVLDVWPRWMCENYVPGAEEAEAELAEEEVAEEAQAEVGAEAEFDWDEL